MLNIRFFFLHGDFADVRCRQNSRPWIYVLAYRWGALPCRWRLSLPSLLASPSPLPAPQSPSLSLAPAIVGQPSALTLIPRCALAKKTPLPIRSRRCSRAPATLPHCGARPSPFPPLGARTPLRSCSPRHAGNPRAPCGRFCPASVAGVSACRGGIATAYAAIDTPLRGILTPCGERIRK